MSLFVSELRLGDDPTIVQLRQTRPVILLSCWAVLIFTLARFSGDLLQHFVLPRLQAVALQVVSAVVLTTLAFTHFCVYEESMSDTIPFFVTRLLLGYGMLIGSVGLPRLGLLEASPPICDTADGDDATARSRLRMGSSEGCESAAELLADDTFGIRAGRGAAVMLLFVRPVLLLFLPDQRLNGVRVMGWAAWACDLLCLLVAFCLCWLAAKQAEAHLERSLPQFGYTAFAIGALSFAQPAHTLLSLILSLDEFETIIFTCVLVVESTFVAVVVCNLMSTHGNPLLGVASDMASEEQNLLRPCCESSRRLMMVSPLDAFMVSLGLRLSNEVVSSSDDEEDSAESPPAQAPPGTDMKRLGKKAMDLWSRKVWSNAIAYWPGCEAEGDNAHLVPPDTLTASEKDLGDTVGLVRRSHWVNVCGDTFTDRVRSKSLAVIIASLWATRFEEAYKVITEVSGDNQILAVFLQLASTSMLWVALCIMLIGNNPFTCSKVHRVWALCLCLYLGYSFYYKVSVFVLKKRIMQEGHSAEALSFSELMMSSMSMWISFATAGLGIAGMVVALRVAIRKECHVDWSETELNALRYTNVLLRKSAALMNLRSRPLKPGEEVLLQKGEGQVRCVLESDCGDGTVDVKLADGRMQKKARKKHIQRQDVAPHEDLITSRLKNFFTAASYYPSTLYFGAAATLPCLLGINCAFMYGWRIVLRRLFRWHCLCCVAQFMLSARVVTEVPVENATMNVEERQQLAMDAIMDWHWNNSFELPTSRNLGPDLRFRWDDEVGVNATPSLSCSQNPISWKLQRLISDDPMKRNHGLIDLTTIVLGAEHMLSLMGVPINDRSQTYRSLSRFWYKYASDRDVTVDAKSFEISPSMLGVLLCEFRLFSTHARSSKIERLVESLGRNATVSVALDLLDEDDDGELSMEEAVAPLAEAVKTVAPPLGKNADDLISNGWSVADKNGDGRLDKSEVLRFAELLVEDAAKAPQVIQLLKGAVDGLPIDGGMLLSLLDRDGDHKLDLEHEVAPIVQLIGPVCSVAGCSSRASPAQLWQILGRADEDGDGFLNADDVKRLAVDLVEVLTRGQRVTSAVCDGEPSALPAILDSDGSGSLDVTEALEVGTAMSSRTSLDGWIMKAFSSADLDNDNVLSPEELEQSRMLKRLAEFCPKPAASFRRLDADIGGASDGDEPPRPLLEEEEEEEEPVIAAMESIAMTILGILSNDAIPGALVALKYAVQISLASALVSIVWIVGRCFSKYRELFEAMQHGKHEYVGRTQQSSLKSAFSETTLFPGALFGTAVIGFHFVAVLSFICLCALALLIVPFFGILWFMPFLPMLMFLAVAQAVKKIIQYLLLDGWLVDNGNIIHPCLFSLFWFITLFLNFVLGVSIATCRMFLVLVTSTACCCFVDFTVMPESLVFFDSVYYALISMAYTHHEQWNPIKKCFVTLVAGPSVHRVYGPRRDDDEEEDEGEESEEGKGAGTARRTPAFLRARNRFWLAVTLHNNPEVRKYRKTNIERMDDDQITRGLHQAEAMIASTASQVSSHVSSYIASAHRPRLLQSSALVAPMLATPRSGAAAPGIPVRISSAR